MSDPVDRVASWVIEARRQNGFASGGVVPASAPSFAAITPTETLLPRHIIAGLGEIVVHSIVYDGPALKRWFAAYRGLLDPRV